MVHILCNGAEEDIEPVSIRSCLCQEESVPSIIVHTR